MSYADFLARKQFRAKSAGFDADLSPYPLMDYQSAIVQWALRRGKAAIFADTGLGKTIMQLTWAAEVARHTGGKVLILAPLAVTAQTVEEARKFGIPVGDVVNYEQLHNIDTAEYVGVVLDESSILKGFDGLLHKQLQKDSTISRQGIPDYLVMMRKPGVNDDPVDGPLHYFVGDDNLPDQREVTRADGSVAKFPKGRATVIDVWQRYASPVWMDINQTRTLQYQSARDSDDERHICLAAGSLVLTREHGYLEIEEVEPGDNVLTHRGRWMPVIAKRCNGIAGTVRVAAQGVANLVTTPDHKLWARVGAGSRAKAAAMKATPEWVDAESTLGSYLNLPLPPEEPSALTEDEWWIVGRWLGDGHRGGHRRSGKRGGLGQFFISCNHNEAAGLIDKLGPHAGHAAQVAATQIALIGLRDEVRDVLDRCGTGAANKRLPGEAVAISQKKAEALLAGYLSADGHYVEKHDRCCASSVSRSLLLGMAIVAQRARGVVASVYAGRADREGEIEGRPVRMMQDWIFAFRNSDGYRKSGWIADDGAWKKVRKIEVAGEAEVWDLQVAEDSSFVAEGAAVHNCPLQLDVIERAMQLWSKPGDVVLTPFLGIGSEAYVAVKMGRKAIGFELKPSYFNLAARNLEDATRDQYDLFGAA